MSIQYHMRAWNGSTYVNWVVNDSPDLTGELYPQGSSGLTNITINKIVNSKIPNYIKPLSSLDGTAFHINSYDLLKPLRTNSDTDGYHTAVAVPTKNSGLAIVRGTSDGYTPRNYASAYWNENQNCFVFGFTDNELQTLVSTKPIIAGHLSILEGDEDGYISIKNNSKNPATTGVIRIPNAENIIARNFLDSSDITLIGIDTLNRIIIGGSSDNTLLGGNIKVDGYVANGTNHATTGFIRTSNNTTILAARNNSNSANLSILASNASDVISIGDNNNSDIRYTTLGQHEFRINSSDLLRLGFATNGYLSFDSGIFNPNITQDTVTSGNGQNFTVAAQSSSFAGSYGGSTILKSGTGLTSDGYIDLRSGNNLKLRLFGNTVPVVSDFTNNSSENPNSILSFADNFRFYNTNSSVIINFDPTTSNTGGDMSIVGQNANINGGSLNIKSGTGSTNNGNINLLAGDNTLFTATSDKNILHRGLRYDVVKLITDITIDDTDGYSFVLVDSSAGSITITLPAAPTEGDVYTFKDSGSAAANNWTLDGNGANIDGSPSISVSTNYSRIKVMYIAGAYNAWFRLVN